MTAAVAAVVDFLAPLAGYAAGAVALLLAGFGAGRALGARREAKARAAADRAALDARAQQLRDQQARPDDAAAVLRRLEDPRF